MTLAEIGYALLPYDFSSPTALAFAAALVFYLLGLRWLPAEERIGPWRVLVFLLGLGMCYGVMHTRFDYYAQYMFFIHRGQHLILHHLGPFLIVLSNPLPLFRLWYRMIPGGARPWLMPLGWAYKTLQQPLIAAVLFVGLVYFWLWPSIHFDAMLSRNLYWLMNWSMLIDGLLFWWLMLDPRNPDMAGTLSYGKRIVILIAIMIPQIALGAWITLNENAVYDVYAVCGRAWPLDPATDQMLGGILTWIPPAMMSVIGTLILLGFMAREDRLERFRKQTSESVSAT
jgi:putative membrane protein